MFRSLSFGLLSLAAVLVMLPGSSNAANHTISVGDFFYSPLKTHVAVGDSVIWVFSSVFTHTSTSDLTSAKTWESGLKTTGQFGIKITAGDGPGPFPYHCAVHLLTMLDTIFVNPPPCCVGLTGNVDNDPDKLVDISDLISLVNYLYVAPFTPPVCLQSANIDGDAGNLVDISDLIALVNYLYVAPFPPPAACL